MLEVRSASGLLPLLSPCDDQAARGVAERCSTMASTKRWKGSYEIRVRHRTDGFLVELLLDGVEIESRGGVPIENVGPLAAQFLVRDLASRLDGM
jgi:hypothetical protein